MADLKPCPFCGDPYPAFHGAIIVCSNSECGASVSTRSFHNPAGMVREKWNRRPQPLASMPPGDAPARDESGNPITQRRWESILVRLEEALRPSHSAFPSEKP